LRSKETGLHAGEPQPKPLRSTTALPAPAPNSEQRNSLGSGRASDRRARKAERDAVADLADEHMLLGSAQSWLPRISGEGTLWFVGVALVLAGSLYFTQTNWARWTPSVRVLVVSAGLIAYQALFIGLSRVVSRRSKSAARVDPAGILGAVAVGLGPIVGFALSAGSQEGLPAWQAVGLGGLAAGVGTLAARGLGAGGVSAAVAALVGMGLWPSAAPIIAFVAWCHVARRAIASPDGPTLHSSAEQPADVEAALQRQTRVRIGYTMLGYLAAAIAAGAVHATGALWVVAPGVGLVALVLARRVERSVTDDAPRLAVWRLPAPEGVGSSALGIAAMLASGIAVALAFTGPLADIPARVSVLVTALLASRALAGLGFAQGKRLAIAAATSVGLVAYFFVPAPFKAVLAVILESVSNALGYSDQPLPVAYYGITFVPYMAAVAWASRRLSAAKPTDDRRSPPELTRPKLASSKLACTTLARPKLAATMQLWLLAVAVALMAMSMTAGDDPRPVVMTMPLYGAAFALWARRSHRWLDHAALTAFAITAAYLPLVALPNDLCASGLGLTLGAAAAFLYPGFRRGLVGRYAVGLSLVGVAMAAGDTTFFAGASAIAAATLLGRAVVHRSHQYAAFGWCAAATAAVVLAAPGGVLPWLAPTTGPTLAVVALGFALLGRALRGALVPRPSDLGGSRSPSPCAPRPSASRRAPFTLGATATQLAPFAAVVAALPLVLGGPPITWVAVLAVLAVAPWSTGFAPWAAVLPGVSAVAMTSALSLSLASAAAIALIATAVAARVAAQRKLQTHRNQRLVPPLEWAVAGLGIAALVSLSWPVPMATRWLLVGAAFAAYAALGRQLILLVSHVVLAVVAISTTLEWVELAAPLEAKLAAAMLMLFTHAWCTLEDHPPRWGAKRGWLRRDPSRRTYLALVVGGGVLCAGLLAIGIANKTGGVSWRDVAFAAAGVLLAYRIGGAIARGVAWPLAGAAVASFFGGIELVPVGAAVGAAGALIVRPAATSALALLAAIVGAAFVDPTALGLTLCAAAVALRLARHDSDPHGPVRGLATATATALGVVLLSTPLLPEPARLPLGAAIIAAFGVFHRGRDWAFTLDALAIVAAGASIILFPDAGLLARAALWSAALLAGACALGRARRGSVPAAVVAELAAAALWFDLRTRMPWLAELPNVDTLACIGATFVSAGAYAYLQRRDEGAAALTKALAVTQLVLPMVGLLAVDAEASWANAFLALGAAAAYGVVSKVARSKWAASFAALAFDLAAGVTWLRLGLDDPQLLAIPVSLSLLVLGQIYRRELKPSTLAAIRFTALGLTYLSGFVSVMAFDAPHHGLLMAAACVAGVIAGAVLQIRSYLFLGAGFLVIDLGVNIVRFGLQGAGPATIVLVGMGSVIIASLIAWTLNREAFERRAARFAGELESWAL